MRRAPLWPRSYTARKYLELLHLLRAHPVTDEQRDTLYGEIRRLIRAASCTLADRLDRRPVSVVCVPESPQDFHARVVGAVARDGYRDPAWSRWTTWPFDGDVSVCQLDPPAAEEPSRQGESGLPCPVCDERAASIWHDEHFRLGVPPEPTGLPFAAWLMPLQHGDLSDLDDDRAARLGVLLVHLERAVRTALHVPRVQVARWGDGAAHLHLYVYARPTGQLQLRGTFLSHWDDLLPRVPTEMRDADAALVAAALARTAGGVALRPSA